ncbi:unnamed protein product [Bursaphelenchus okinawaensis]|uniref:Uncharacterized protein n=1 Tax=Bursaphelenchus okinawaensis TaxID=465554 RepID=A0A811KU08_9BILA|nr:unnamed protein product [Bursaphelenchus okinawaensis]CAG9112429.1 unnamed protein product [Bursaphelenchus okinawaensis]
MSPDGFVACYAVLLSMQALGAVVSLSSTAYLINHYKSNEISTNVTEDAVRWAVYFIPLSSVWYVAMATVWIVSIALSTSIICIRSKGSVIPNIVVLCVGIILNLLVIGVSLGYILDIDKSERTHSKGNVTIIYNIGLLGIVLIIMCASVISLCCVRPVIPERNKPIQMANIFVEQPVAPIPVQRPPDISPAERDNQLNRFYQSEIINNQ